MSAKVAGRMALTKFPTTLEGFGYAFNAEGKLRKVDPVTGLPGDQAFEFNISPDPICNQKHYDALGDVITEKVYLLLEEEGLKRALVPPESEFVKSFIYVSDNSQTAEKLLLLIHGTGVVKAGQWSRSVIINDSLESGTQLPYIRKAKELGYGIMVLNTNDNFAYKEGRRYPIKGSSSPHEHSHGVWHNYVLPAKAEKIAIVAHSFGGIVTMSLASHFEEDFLKRVCAIALTDSVHGKIPRAVSSELAEHLAKVGRNWVSCNEVLDKPMDEQAGEILCVSAGTPKHEYTSATSIDSVMSFVEQRFNHEGQVSPGKDQL